MSKREINFTCTTADRKLALKIAKRAESLAREYEIKGVKKLDVVMDIIATHRNGCPLRLEELLAADNVNFGHDVFGIRRHLDRGNGTLGDCFLPRFHA